MLSPLSELTGAEHCGLTMDRDPKAINISRRECPGDPKRIEDRARRNDLSVVQRWTQ